MKEAQAKIADLTAQLEAQKTVRSLFSITVPLTR